MRKYALLQLLWGMKRGELLNPHFGICHHLNDLETRTEKSRAKMWMQQWPEYSGCPTYPVAAPSTYEEADLEGAYDDHDKWVGEYGSSRIRLLNYLIRRCEEYHEEQAS